MLLNAGDHAMCSVERSDELTIIVIDDDPDHLNLMKSTLRSVYAKQNQAITVACFEQPVHGLAELSDSPNQVVLIDYQLVGSTGIDWLLDFVKAGVGPVIVVTSSGDESIAADAFRHGASDYLVKSDVFCDPSVLKRSISESIRRFQLELTNKELSLRLKQANKDLNRKNEKLVDLTDTAHRFVDDVAHEFRTPLTVIKEFASIISDGLGGEVSEKQSQYLEYITDSARDLAGLVDDFLNSSKLRAKTICVSRQEHQIADLIQAIRPMIESRASARDIRLVLEIQDNLPPIFADADKLQRSLINLVVNAIKFSEAKGEVRIIAKPNDQDSILLEVIDEGPGLPQETVDALFDRFCQGPNESVHKVNGFGLGLSIVKELVAINFGVVSVNSQLGVGSTFGFTVPISDTKSIIHKLAHRADTNASSAQITVLAAHRTHHDQSIPELIESLQDLCYPMDLVLPSPDNTKAYMIGVTSDLEGYREKLMALDLKHNSKADAPNLSPLSIDSIGQWPAHTAGKILGNMYTTPAILEPTNG